MTDGVQTKKHTRRKKRCTGIVLELVQKDKRLNPKFRDTGQVALRFKGSIFLLGGIINNMEKSVLLRAVVCRSRTAPYLHRSQ